MGCVRRFSPYLSLSLSFIEMFVFRFDNDNYRYRLSSFFAVVVPKLSDFRYPTLYRSRRRVACSFPSGKLYCNVTTVLANNKQEARQQHVIPSPLPRRQKKKGENYKKKRERNKREKKEKRTLRKQEK